MGQQLGWWRRTRNVPGWFQEGLADWVADTGDEQVGRRQAAEAIRRGPRLVPDDTGHLPLPRTATDYGLAWPMYHSQARMFVTYLAARDQTAFAAFLRHVLRGERFDQAFDTQLGTNVAHAWKEFAATLEP
jgi:hypothetical protein